MSEADDQFDDARFDGADYVPEIDDGRLTGQIRRVFDLMRDGRWRTLDEIASTTGDPAASISAQLRHLRKERFGAYTVNRRARGDRAHGLFEYQVVVPATATPATVRCIECANITSEGVPARLARCGLSACREIKQPTGTFFTLEYERQCPQFQPAPDVTVAARRAWLDSPTRAA